MRIGFTEGIIDSGLESKFMVLSLLTYVMVLILLSYVSQNYHEDTGKIQLRVLPTSSNWSKVETPSL